MQTIRPCALVMPYIPVTGWKRLFAWILPKTPVAIQMPENIILCHPRHTRFVEYMVKASGVPCRVETPLQLIPGGKR